MWSKAEQHLQHELARLLLALHDYLNRQRVRGRTPAGDAVAGYVIEDGEAEGLLYQLRAEVESHTSAQSPPHSLVRDGQPGILARPDEQSVQDVSLPLCRAAITFELSALEYDALLLALAVELDSRFGRLIAYLNDHAGRTRPTLGLALAIQPNGDGWPFYLPAAMFERPFSFAACCRSPTGALRVK